MADDKDAVKLSRLLSLVLRHKPGRLDLTLDPQGWVAIDTLIAAAIAHGIPITRDAILDVVATSDKQRFAIDPGGRRIRANQGHSVEIDLELTPLEPPATLFHGTAEPLLPAIRAAGLVKGDRHHVHLSTDEALARRVGRRRGKPVVLRVDSGRMWAAGQPFYRSANGVWLTDAVPVEFIAFP